MKMRGLLIAACVAGAWGGAPAGERAPFSAIPKYLTGAVPELGAWAPKAIPMGTAPLATDPLAAATYWTSAAVMLIPGIPYEYKFTAESGGTTIWDQRPANRAFTVPFEVGVNSWAVVSPGWTAVTWDGSRYVAVDPNGPQVQHYARLASSMTGVVDGFIVLNNWGDIPGPPWGLSGQVDLLPGSTTQAQLALSWQKPVFGTNPIIDLEGGGYLLYHSTWSANPAFAVMNPTFVPAGFSWASPVTLGATIYYLIPGTQHILAGLAPDATHYVYLRAVDAYDNPLPERWSPPSAQMAFTRTMPVTFTVEVTGQVDVKAVWLAGEMLAGSLAGWLETRRAMLSNGDGTWSAILALPRNSLFQYKYLINDDRWEERPNFQPTISSNTAGNREVRVAAPAGGASLHLRDVWGVNSIPEEVPFSLISLAIAAEGTANRLLWEPNPAVPPADVSGYEIARTTDAAAPPDILSPTLPAGTTGWTDAAPVPATTNYYALVTVSGSGGKTFTSLARPGETLPKNLAGLTEPDAATPRVSDLAAGPGRGSGQVVLKWTAPPRHPALGGAGQYLVRYATWPITSWGAFVRGQPAAKLRARLSGVREELVTANLGEDCPAFYFAVASLFGRYEKASISNLMVGVAGKLITSDGGSVTKRNRIARDGPSGTAITVPAYALPVPRALLVIQQAQEWQGATPALAADVAAANQAAAQTGKLLVPPENANPADPANGVFIFDGVDLEGQPLYRAGADTAASRVYRIPVTIALPFRDDNQNGVLDSTEGTPEPIATRNLRVYRLREAGRVWALVRDGMNEVDPAARVVRAEVQHFSTYALLARGRPAQDLSSVVAYPNPFKPTDGRLENGEYGAPPPYGGIIFTNLTARARVWIYTLAGEIAQEVPAVDETTGEAYWKGVNDSGDPVASGLYLYVVTDDTLPPEKVRKKVGRLVVIR